MSSDLWFSQNKKGYVVGCADREIAQLGFQDEKLARLFKAAPEMLAILERIYSDTIANGESADAEQVRILESIIDIAKGKT